MPEKSSRVVLSARQLAIVRQLSTGATDRDIAVALGLSPRTVSNTLSKIYDKLGVSSRAYLATLFVKGQIRDGNSRLQRGRKKTADRRQS